MARVKFLPRPCLMYSAASRLSLVVSGPQPTSSTSNRVLVGGRSWAGAIATPIPVSKLETLCTPCEPPPGAPPGPALAPLQRFLACVYMKRTLQRFVQQEEYVSLICL